MSALLDANVLIALTVTDHVHHHGVESWFVSLGDTFATCPITQGALVRHLLRTGSTARTALDVLESLVAHERHEFWADDLDFTRVQLRGVIGHRQVTDAYLAALARTRGARLATLDGGMSALHPDVTELVEP